MEYIENEKIIGLKLRDDEISNKEYIDCEFQGCSFVDVKINNCIFKDCTFKNSTMNNVEFKFSTMRNSTLSESEFIGINWSALRGDSFSINPINKVENCFFKYNNFISMRLNSFDFSNSKFQEVLFEECELMDASFENVKFQGTQFIECNLKRADFREAYGYIIDINSNKLEKARFSFPEVTSLLNSIDIIIE